MPKELKLSEQVRAAIENCGHSRYRISQETGVSQSTLSRFMQGERTLSQAALDEIGEYLGLQIVATEGAVSSQGKRTRKTKGN